MQFRNSVVTLVELHEWPSVNWNNSGSKWQTAQLTVVWFSDVTQTVQSSVKWQIGKWWIVSRNSLVLHQSSHRKMKRFSVTPKGLAWRQMVECKPIWCSITAVGLRRNRQKYKSEMDKSSLKWNSRCEVLCHNPVVFRRPLVVVSYGSDCLDFKCPVA